MEGCVDVKSKKIFISADIEGTCGIAHWHETDIGKPGYDAFAQQMTREVAAACEGAVAGGAEAVLVKDAHDSARNIDARALPRCASSLRGWTRDPYCMMAGLNASFDGVFCTGYHSPAGTDANPLAHTMALDYSLVTINGEIASELTISCLIAAMLRVPVLLVTGDEGLCAGIQRINPHIRTVPVNRGIGNGALSIHPDVAVERIREAARDAVSGDLSLCLLPLPERFVLEVTYREHALAHRNGFYPQARQTGPRTVVYETEDYNEALRFMLFCL